jgi:hypothetical protein
MSGYYFLALALTLAFVGIGFYMLGPKLEQWDERLTRQLKEIEAKRGWNRQGVDGSAPQTDFSSMAVGPQDIGVAGSSTSHRVASAAPIGTKKGGVVLPASDLGAFRLVRRVYVCVRTEGRGVVIPPKLNSAVKARHLSSRVRRGVGTQATRGLSSAPRRRVPARKLSSNQ